MFSKIWASCVLVSVLCLEVTAHAIVTPALGVDHAPAVRGDVQRPNNASPCGGKVTNIPAALDSATAVPADEKGSFTVTGQNFNNGVDGSLHFKAQVDATGTGKTFVPMTISKNGLVSPQGAGSTSLVASLPAGTKCTGGATKNTCLVKFVSDGGFGSCVAVSQSSGDAGTPPATANGGNSAASGKGKGGKKSNSAATANGGKSATTPAASNCSGNNTASTGGANSPTRRHAGSLMARSLIASVMNSGSVEVAQRDTSGPI